jgi:phosphoribosylformimino-5-aminoimidazole carboxamide ribotide isomerase
MTHTFFRPCIDLHQGKVKQIVGSTLRDGCDPVTNFETDRSAAWFADLYRRDGLAGGHVILLGPGNEAAAREALAAYPGGLQVGGGVNPENAPAWLEAGASHVIVTSYVFQDGKVKWDNLRRLSDVVPRERLVLDLSCRKRQGDYYVVTDRWQKFTSQRIDAETLLRFSEYADEFLVHAADVEGKQQGVDLDLVALLARFAPISVTYAGGVSGLADLREVYRVSRGRLGVTIGSALDIFGGPLAYRTVVEFCRELKAGTAE